MNEEEFVEERTWIISEMLDNPDECEIYPTTKCFNELDLLFRKIISEEKQKVKEVIRRIPRLCETHMEVAPEQIVEYLEKELGLE